MAKNKKNNIWNEAIENKNLEAEKQREASEFFSDSKEKKVAKKSTSSNEADPIIKVEEVVKTEILEKEVLKYTNKKPFKNMEGREVVNTHNQVIELEKYGPQDSKKHWTILGVIFSALLSAIIIIPLVMLAAGAALVVDSVLTMQEMIGYQVNVTEFAVKHEESGMYLQSPTYEGEQLILGKEKIDTFMFVDSNYYLSEDKPSDSISVPNYGDLWLKSDMIFNGREMNLTYSDGKVVWTGIDLDSSIYLKKDENNRNRFSISLEDEKAFIAKDEESNRIILSKNPDWFTFETNVDFIKTSTDYLVDYANMNLGLENFNQNLELGKEGNSITLYSTKTGLCLNSYKEVNHDELPIFSIERNEYEDSLYLSEDTDTNLFIQHNEVGEMAFSSYQTLPFERYATDEWQKYYPLLTANDDGSIKLETFDLTPYANTSMEASEISNAQFWLLPNPNNLREKAIFFPAIGKFLTTENNTLGLQEISTEDEVYDLDFFKITHSPNKNPEVTEIRKASTISGVGENIVEITENPDVINGYEFYGYGYENTLDTAYNPSNYFTEARGKTNCRKTKSVIKLRDLEERTTYHGIIATYRNKDAGVGKHITFTYVPPFTTGDKGIDWPDGWPNINWPNINWPDINWPDIWPELPQLPIIDPGDPIIDGGKGDPSTAIIWDSTDEINSKNSSNDVPVNEMLSAASTEIEVSVNVTQGTQDGITKDLGVRLQETDVDGNIVTDGYDQTQTLGHRPITGQDYSVIFEGLTPETNYLATVVFYDGHTPFEQVQSSPLKLDEGETQMKATSERVVPTFVSDETSYTWDMDGSGFSVYTLANDIRPTDELMVVLHNNRTNAEETTGWIKASDWETAVVPNWTFSHNERVDGSYYEATCTSAIALDTYDVHMWLRMDTSTDFVGWDATSPAFDDEYNKVTSDSQFDVIEIMNIVGITAGKQHIIK